MLVWMCDVCRRILDGDKDGWLSFNVARGSFGEEDYEKKTFHACPDHHREVEAMQKEVIDRWTEEAPERKTRALYKVLEIMSRGRV
jgi:hypothetical protein